MTKQMNCPSCGGSGGGPFGRMGSAWDREDYVCPRCEGRGAIAAPDVRKAQQPVPKAPAAAKKPGLAKGRVAKKSAKKKKVG